MLAEETTRIGDGARDAMKLRATLLLAGAAVVFVIARYFEARYGFWVGAIRATAEASLVGGLADWLSIKVRGS